MDWGYREKLERDKDSRREESKEKDRRLKEQKEEKDRLFRLEEKEKDRQFTEQQSQKKADLTAQMHAFKESSAVSLLERQHDLTPEQLDNLYFDAVRHAKLQHAYEEKVRQLNHERERELRHEKHEMEMERMEHKVKWEVILQKSLIKLRQQYGGDSGLSEQDINAIVNQVMVDGNIPPDIDISS